MDVSFLSSTHGLFVQNFSGIGSCRGVLRTIKRGELTLRHPVYGRRYGTVISKIYSAVFLHHRLLIYPRLYAHVFVMWRSARFHWRLP